MHKLTHDEVDLKLNNINVKRLENFKNTNSKINFQCLNCFHIWKTSLKSVLSKNINSIIIEYNGQQHYEIVKFGGISLERATLKFENQKKRDAELKQYCIDNNIYFLEIPYFQKKEETIKQLSLLNNLSLIETV